MRLTDKTLWTVGLVLGGALLLWMYEKGVGGVAQSVATGAVQAAGGLAAGAVIGASSVVGIPQTSMTKCQKDLAAGDYWSASFDCPAGTFVKGVF